MKKLLPCFSDRNGQVVLTILLVMSVILVVGLSIASRSVTDIKISQQSQESARALWVAQAGLEQAIKSNKSVGVDLPSNLGGVEYSVDKAAFGGGSNEFVFPMNMAAGEIVTFWLAGHDDATGEITTTGSYPADKTLTFYWGKGGFDGESAPALEATLVYKDAGGNFLTKRYPYDPLARSSPTNFDPARTSGCGTVGGTDFSFCSETISLPGLTTTPYFVRLKLLFNTTSQPIGLKGDAGVNFPSQGNYFDSTAKVTESAVTERLTQYQFWKTTLPIFDYVIFSGADLQ